MKTIHLIRHAKSDWSNPELSDIERPLNSRGQKACKIMAPHIVEAGCGFEHVFCSIAARAQLTIQGISEALPDREVDWQLEDALYTFSSQSILYWCQSLDNDLNEIVIVGHNPAFTEFCNGMGDQYIANLPTCGYAQISFPQANWQELTPSSGETISILIPKQFRN